MEVENGNKYMKNYKRQAIIELILVGVLLVLLNFVATTNFIRLDLTKEKRFTLSNSSKEIAASLPDVVYFKVFLEGDFDARFKRLQQSLKETLDEFKSYSNGKIQYEFIDPNTEIMDSSGTNEEKQERYTRMQQLIDLGLKPTSLQIDQDNEFSRKTIFPGALVSVKGTKDFPMDFLREQFGMPAEIALNQSIENLEYDISNALKKCINIEKKKIAYTVGHGELDKDNTASLTNELTDYYDVERIRISDFTASELNKFACLIIAKPDSLFENYELSKLDQYVMHGGKLLMLVENVRAEMDSLKGMQQTFAPIVNTGLEEMLFRYGVRLNPVLLKDLACTRIQLTEKLPNGGTQPVYKPWTFAPLFFPQSEHPIVRNLEPVAGMFGGTLDTVGREGVTKTVLLRSSDHAKILQAPVMLSIEGSLVKQQDMKLYTNEFLPVAVLLEGKFNSIFKNYGNDSITKLLDYKNHIDNNRMIIIADGDIIKNKVLRQKGNLIVPLGFDNTDNVPKTYGNKKFLMNCIEYLVEGSKLMDARSKKIEIRPLDREKIKLYKSQYQWFNIVFPILLVILFAYINKFIRKQRNT